ncbi:hypothetical protein RMSM_06020 [Rhodopirellula maiorica SM1]|uniref:Uncharacterized protein n=2 Tax=Novipirellula TaxID=2795426 RepID=M5RDA7_9BACT|nr:hypothetical protein RMSM_06020 [Rhodopirellula maiorica SM1]
MAAFLHADDIASFPRKQALAADPASSLLVADRFDQPVQNRLGGYRCTFQRSPSFASALRVSDPRRGDSGHSMRIKATKADAGFCGYWIHFFDMHALKPTYFDARAYTHLSFWVRGERGGESFNIRLSDENWIAKEDSELLGPVDQFLDGGVTQAWQEVIVPLRSTHIDCSHFAGLTLEFATVGEFTVHVEDVAFKSNVDQMIPASTATKPQPQRPQPTAPPRTLWLWSTQTLLGSTQRWHELFDFCKAHNVGQIWLQLPYKVERTEPSKVSATAPEASPSDRITVLMKPELRSFIAKAHSQNIRIHALDGAPEHCLTQNHDIPLGVVDAVLQFNSRANEQEKFDGVHFDNEPYLLLGWHSPSRREQILREYLELNAECQRRVREGSNMQFGVDIPFWWQATDKNTGESNAAVEFNGVRKAASFHCIDMLDNVGVMNYRDRADGADGIIAHGRALMEYGQRQRGASIFMGVETFREVDRPVWFLVGLPREKFQRALTLTPLLADQSLIEGHRVRTMDDGENIHVGIEIAHALSDQQRAAAERSLRLLASQFYWLMDDAEKEKSRRAKAESMIDSDAQWRTFARRDLAEDGETPRMRGFVTKSVMPSKVTFADNSIVDFDEQTSAAENYFRDFECFGGLAIHFYETYRSLCETPSADKVTAKTKTGN